MNKESENTHLLYGKRVVLKTFNESIQTFFLRETTQSLDKAFPKQSTNCVN